MDIVNDAVQLHFGNATHVISKYSYIYLYIYIYIYIIWIGYVYMMKIETMSVQNKNAIMSSLILNG